MTIFRIELVPEFRGDTVLLASADHDGLRLFDSAVRSAREEGQATFEIDGIHHRIIRQLGAADISAADPQTIVWKFDDTKLAEIIDMLTPMLEHDRPGHQYIDYLNSPASTLVISVDEYI